MSDGGIDIFISHSSRDVELAETLVELFRAAYALPAKKIRCTSVDGYRLKTGADTNAQLREETVGSRVLVGLITEVSIESAYVLFELGARWGANRYLAPLVGAGAGARILAGPLGGLNAMKCTRPEILQLVGDVAEELGITPEQPNVYVAKVDSLLEVSEKLELERAIESGEPKVSATRTETLKAEECDYLMLLGRPRNEGFIYGGVDEHNGREAAEFQGYIRRFEELDLVLYGNGGYRFTTKAWKLYDQLWELEILEVLRNNEIDHEDDISEAVKLTDGDQEREELNRLLYGMENKGYVKLTRSSGGIMVQILEPGLTQRKHKDISLLP